MSGKYYTGTSITPIDQRDRWNGCRRLERLRCERVPSILGNARDDSKAVFAAWLDHGSFPFGEIRRACDCSKRIPVTRDREIDAARHRRRKKLPQIAVAIGIFRCGGSAANGKRRRFASKNKSRGFACAAKRTRQHV